jgi:hypothetical protein
MVLRHTNAIFAKPVSREKTTKLTLAFWREVEMLQETMTFEDAAYFKKRIDFRMDEALEGWQKAVGAIPNNESSVPVSVADTGQTKPNRGYRGQSSNYVGRTVVRAVVRNAVNSLFRNFR